jgi:hypothetical protein
MGVMGACAYLLELSLMRGVAISPEAARPGPEDNYPYKRPEISPIGPWDESCSGKGTCQFLKRCVYCWGGRLLGWMVGSPERSAVASYGSGHLLHRPRADDLTSRVHQENPADAKA